MEQLKHLPVSQWPASDRLALAAAYVPGDIFDDGGGPGSHLAQGTRSYIECSYRRWLGFLALRDEGLLQFAPIERITRDLVYAYIDHLSSEVRRSSVYMNVHGLLLAARLIGPQEDWRWLKAIVARLASRAEQEDRFPQLIEPWFTLDLGYQLMDLSRSLIGSSRLIPDIQYRDGLIIALLSLWPIRRRSLANLTVLRHVLCDAGQIRILLHPCDTKPKRSEEFLVPTDLAIYVSNYLDNVRPNLLGDGAGDALWISYRGGSLSSGAIYNAVRRHLIHAFDRRMGLHDFRRAAATFIALEAPEKVGLIPGVLQHASPDVSQKHYNLAKSTAASRRFTSVITQRRKVLRPRATKTPGVALSGPIKAGK